MWEVISVYLCGIITTIEVMFFAKMTLSLSNKNSRKKLIFSLLITSLVHTIIYFIFQKTMKSLMMFLVDIYVCKKVFNISYLKSIFLNFLWFIVLTIPDIVMTIFMTKVLNLSTYYYNEFAGSVMSNLIIFVLFSILTYVLRDLLKKTINISVEENVRIIIYYFLTFICVIFFFYKSFSNLVMGIDLAISIFIMIAFLIILFSLTCQTLENNKLTEKYEKLLDYMKTYENEIEKQRILRHEVKNEFRTIRAKICDKQVEQEIIEYIDEIVNDKYEVKQEEYAKFGYLPPNGIKGLCYFKTQEAEEKGIQIALNISKRIKQSTIYELDTKGQRDFGKILGVYLDNAIEASLNSEAKQLGIEAYMNKEKEFKMIISNSYDNTIDKEKIGKETFSTKGKTRGHGLLLVKHITERNSLFKTTTSIQDKIYVQTIIVKKNRV